MTDPTDEVQVDPIEAALAAPPVLGALDRKIIAEFPELVVRKDLTNGLKQNAIVPTYVLEYLLGQNCATDDPDALRSGLESVQRILAKHYVHRNQAELVKSDIKERGGRGHKVIDKVTAELNDKAGFYEAKFMNLGLAKVPIEDDLVRRHPKLLVGGIWSITELSYSLGEDPKASPWHIESLKPIQVSGADYDEFLATRARFTSEEWTGLILQSLGFNPEALDRRGRLLQLLRLVPFCERNYNLIELGPKGTGKSHVYAEFSPHGILISGAEVTAAKLFVNNATGKIGLVGYWDCICFDEFAGKDKNVDKNVVDIMKNYMANKSFSRGIEQLSAEASVVFMGNTKAPMEHMLRHTHFFEPLPDKYIDSAFLDRLHAYAPGWEVPPVRSDLFTRGYGFIVDYLAEILKHQRSEDFTAAYQDRFEIVSELSKRDQTGFEKTFSGLMKLLYPHGGATPDEIEELLGFSLECRRRVREHILRIDDTFEPHDFVYLRKADDTVVTVLTPEERAHPEYVRQRKVAKPEPELPEAPEEERDGEGSSSDIAGGEGAEAEDGRPGLPGAEPSDEWPAVSFRPIEDLLAAGEGQHVEFKAAGLWNRETRQRDKAIEDAILKTIAGFMNADGGTLLIGVNDDGEPTGLAMDYHVLPKKNWDGFLSWLTNLVHGRIDIPVAPLVRIQRVEIDGKEICRVDVRQSSKPAFAKKGSEMVFYVRILNSTRPLTGPAMLQYLEARASES